jgi:hypothetical protein
MQFDLLQIHFPEQKPDSEEQITNPSFSTLRSFKTLGIVMNVFLLDPEARLLAGFVWISRSNNIGLYVLFDWDKEEYCAISTICHCHMSQTPYGMAYRHFVTRHRPLMAWPIGILSHVTGLFTQIPKKMIICTFLWPKTLKIDLIWPIFGLFLDPSHVTDLSWPIVPFGLSTNSVTPSHAMAYGRNGTVLETLRDKRPRGTNHVIGTCEDKSSKSPHPALGTYVLVHSLPPPPLEIPILL